MMMPTWLAITLIVAVYVAAFGTIAFAIYVLKNNRPKKVMTREELDSVTWSDQSWKLPE
jgi:predicted membrane protein